MAVIINGRTAVHKNSNGTLTTQDVCLTTKDKIPVTYTNIAKSADAANTAQTVFVDGNPICHQNSIFATSKGDENGDHKGINSSTIQCPASFVTGSNNVFIEGLPTVRQGDLMVSNNQNTPPAQLQQPGVPPPDAGNDTNQQQLDQPIEPDQINIDVVGINVPALNGTLSADSDNHSLLLGKTGENNGVLRRLEIRNLKPGQYNLCLNKISLGKNLSTTPSKEQQPEIGQAANILVTTELRWRTDLDNKPLKPPTGDYTDISRLPSFVRNFVYKDIENYLVQNQIEKPWPQMIQPNTLQLVNEYLQPNKAPELQSGWLYIFKNNQLWQELQVINGYGCGLPTYLTLPYQINNKTNGFEITYSQIKLNNAKNRTDKLDLSPFIQTNAIVNQTTSKDKDTEVTNIRLLQHYMTPTLFISDPLGLVNRIQKDLTNAWLELKDLMLETKNDPYFKSALLAYQTYFNPKLACDQGMSEAQYQDYYQKSGYLNIAPNGSPAPNAEYLAEQPTSFKQAQDYLDKNKLEAILKVKPRRKLRIRIRILQKALIDLIKKPDFNSAISNFFAATEDGYINPFATIAGILGNTCTDPAVMDSNLDIDLDYNPKQILDGQAYALSLFNKNHPLYPKLFPDDSSNFRADDFAKLFELGTSVSELAADTLSSLVQSTAQAIKHAPNSKINNVQEKLVALYQATGIQSFNNLTSTTPDALKENDYIPGYEPPLVTEFITKRNQLKDVNNLHDVKQNYTTIKIVQTDIASIQNKKNIDHLIANAEIAAMQSPNVSNDYIGVLNQDRFSQDAFFNQVKNRYKSSKVNAITYHAEDCTANLKMIYANRSLAALFFALQLFDFALAAKQTELNTNLKVIDEGLYSIYAIDLLTKSWIGKDKPYDSFVSDTGNLSLTPLAIVGIAAASISTYLYILDMISDYKSHDTGKEVGDLLGALGSFFYILGILGDNSVAGSIGAIFFSPFGFIALYCMIVSTLIIEFYSDNDIIKWAKNSPFSIYKSKMTPDEAYQELFTLLMSPALELKQATGKEGTANMCLEIILPYFVLGNSSLDSRLVKQINSIVNNAMPVTGNTPVRVLKEKQQIIQPHTIVQIQDKNTGKIIAIRNYYTYTLTPEEQSMRSRFLTFLAKTRLYLDHHTYSIPLPVLYDAKQQDKNISDNDIVCNKEKDPTWIYSNELAGNENRGDIDND